MKHPLQFSSTLKTEKNKESNMNRITIVYAQDTLRKKLDMLLTLSDIELAQDMLKKKDEEDSKKKKKTDVRVFGAAIQTMNNILLQKSEEEDHPLDKNYGML